FLMKVKKLLGFYHNPFFNYILLFLLALLAVTVVAISINEHISSDSTLAESNKLNTKISSISAELKSLKGVDQFKVNEGLKLEINNINKTYQKASSLFENLNDLKVQNPKLDKKYDQL